MAGETGERYFIRGSKVLAWGRTPLEAIRGRLDYLGRRAGERTWTLVRARDGKATTVHAPAKRRRRAG